jgi:hypothetical protein
MQKLQLYIGGQRVDLFKDETVTLNQTIQNIKDPGKIFVDFTKDFTIPASKNNNLIFKHYYNYDIYTNYYDARFKTAAEIQLNNIPFKNGFVKLEGVDLQFNSPYAYRIVFYGNTVSLKDVLGDDKLQELDLTAYDLDYNVSTVQARLQSISNHILAPLITSGASNEDDPLNPSRLFYNSATSAHTNGTGNMFYHQGTGHDHGVLWSDLKYAIRVHQIILAIQANANYNITFTDDFFNTTNTSYYNLFLWLHRKKGSVQPAEQIESFPTQVTDFDLAQQYTTMLNGTTLEVYSSCNPYASASCPNTSLPSITQSLTFTTTSSDFYDVIIYRNGVVWSTHSNLQGSVTLTQSDMPIMDEAAYTVTIFVASAINITFTNVEWELAGIFNGTPWTENYPTTTSFNADATFRFIVSQQIPEMKILDFLTSLFQMFNLTAFVIEDAADPDYIDTSTPVIRVQPLDDFYANYNSYDISEYVDVKNSTVDAALPYRQINFSYEGTETFLAKQYDQLTGKLWAAAPFTGDSTTNGDSFDGNNQTYNIQIPMEHVLFERLVDANPSLTPANNKTSIQYGYFVDDNQDAYFGKPLLFYPIQINSNSPNFKEISFREAVSQNVNLSQYYIPSNSVSTSAATSTSNINFYQETNEYSPSENFSGTLFNNYYRNYIRSIFTLNRRLIKIKAFLPLKILFNIKLNDILLINNRNFNINSIQTNLQTGESNIELLNDFGQIYLVLSNVSYQNVERDLYYKANIGNAENLKIGDIIYLNPVLNNELSNRLGAGTYTQVGTAETTTHCTTSLSMSMTVNSFGIITAISCS